MSKYKFVLTLPYDYEIDSAEEIEGHIAWPNWSQADPVRYKGIFNSFEEAKAYAADFELYKYILRNQDGPYYDSFEDETDDDYPHCFISIFDAEDAACNDLGISPGDTMVVHPDYKIEEIEEEDPDKGIPAGAYKYCLYHDGECLLDSVEEYDEFFDSYEEAEEMAQEASDDYDIETDELAYELETVEILNIEIVEMDEAE